MLDKALRQASRSGSHVGLVQPVLGQTFASVVRPEARADEQYTAAIVPARHHGLPHGTTNA